MTRPLCDRVFRGRISTQLMAWTIGPVVLCLALAAYSVHRSALRSMSDVHDRLLYATAQQIGDLVRMDRGLVAVQVPLALLEALESGGRSRAYYRVVGADGRQLTGDPAVPPPGPEDMPTRVNEVRSYVARVGDVPVKLLAIARQIETPSGQRGAVVIVGETLDARQQSVGDILRALLLCTVVSIAVVALFISLVVHCAMQPLTTLRLELRRRKAGAIEPLKSHGADEVRPVINEINLLLERQRTLLEERSRFVADASHQLRAPLAVLKTQLQAAMADDERASDLLANIARTVDRATHVSNQLLAKARVNANHHSVEHTSLRLDELARDAVLELSPLIANKHLKFALDVLSLPCVSGDSWMAGELLRNLLANAIRHTPAGQALGIRFEHSGTELRMIVWDTGPGISDNMKQWLFQPFATKSAGGVGLGLSKAMGASITIHNRRGERSNEVLGLNAVVTWKLETMESLHPKRDER